VNSHLKNRNIEVKDLRKDLKNGVNLIHLLEILSSESIKHTLKPRFEVHMRENLANAFEFCKRAGLRFVNIGPEDVYEGTEHLILGLVWQLILKYKFQGQNQSEEMKGLLAWVNSMIPEYNIKNFTSDWQNGKAICALAEAVQPGQFNLPKDFKNDPITDCKLGVESAKVNMGIIALIDVEDIVKFPDQNSMMTYISYFRDYAELLKNQKINVDHEKELLLERTPDLSKCIVYGPALEPGNEAEQETYFTIEIRNAKDKKILATGYEIGVKITGPRSQYQYKANENVDGTQFVTFTPETDGNHIIEVKLNSIPIGLSPFHINISGKPPTLQTRPKPHWYFQDFYETKNWFPLPQNESDAIEKQFEQYKGGVININEFRIDITKREQVNTIKRHIIHFETKPLLRSTWFWEGDDGKMTPYSEEICAILENAYQTNQFNKNVTFQMGKKKTLCCSIPRWQFQAIQTSL